MGRGADSYRTLASFGEKLKVMGGTGAQNAAISRSVRLLVRAISRSSKCPKATSVQDTCEADATTSESSETIARAHEPDIEVML